MTQPLVLNVASSGSARLNAGAADVLLLSGGTIAEHGDLGLALSTYVLSLTSISEIISTRLYPDMLKQFAEMPAAVYSVIDTEREEHLRGDSGFEHARVQFDCFADTRLKANQLAKRFRRALIGMRRTIGVDPGLFVCGVSLASGERHSVDQPINGSDEYRYLTSQDFRISYQIP